MKGYTYWEPLGWIEKKEIKGNHCVYMENPKRDQQINQYNLKDY